MNTAELSSNNPIRQLLDEHEAFRHSCDDLLRLIDRLEKDGYRAALVTGDYALLLKTRETIREHLNIHLVKEELVFFPRLEELVPNGRVKFLFLNYDHEYLRIYFDDFCNAISDFEEDRVPMHISVKRIITSGRLIVENLIKHILTEDNVYFELAEKGFDPATLEAMGTEMRVIEARLKEQH